MQVTVQVHASMLIPAKMHGCSLKGVQTASSLASKTHVTRANVIHTY